MALSPELRLHLFRTRPSISLISALSSPGADRHPSPGHGGSLAVLGHIQLESGAVRPRCGRGQRDQNQAKLMTAWKAARAHCSSPQTWFHCLAVCPWSNAFSSTKHHLEATHVLCPFCLTTTALPGLAAGWGPALTVMPKGDRP